MGDQVRNFVGRGSFQDNGASQGVERLRQGMLSVEQANKQVAAANKELSATLKSLTSDEVAARASAEDLVRAAERVEAAKQQRKAATQEAEQALSNLVSAERAATSSANSLGDAVAGLERDYQRLGTTQATVAARTGTFTAGMSAIGGPLGNAASHIEQIERASGSAVGTLGVLASAAVVAGGALIKMGADAAEGARQIEYEVAGIRSIKPEINADVLERQLQDLSTRIPQTTGQLAEGLYNIFSSIELSGEDAVKLLEKLARGAVAARTDTETFGTAVIGQMNAYKLGVADADHVTDVLPKYPVQIPDFADYYLRAA